MKNKNDILYENFYLNRSDDSEDRRSFFTYIYFLHLLFWFF